jgi:tetratricopeptide repeat protein
MSRVERLVDQASRGPGVDRRVVELVEAGLEARPLSSAALGRIARRLDQRVQRRAVPSVVFWRRTFAVSAVSAVALSSLAVAAAYRFRPSHVAPAVEPQPTVPTPVTRPALPVFVAPLPVDDAPKVAPAALRRAVADARERRVGAEAKATVADPAVLQTETPDVPASAGMLPVAPRSSPRPDPLGQESLQLARAMRQLHHAEPAACLRTLDAYDANFPGGQFSREVFVTRIDAQMALGQRALVREELGRLSPGELQALPRGRELRLLQAELVGGTGDCRAALPALEEVLATPDDPLRGRALFGRASCRARSGDVDGSRKDLERYLEESPDGPFAAEAKKALAH